MAFLGRINRRVRKAPADQRLGDIRIAFQAVECVARMRGDGTGNERQDKP